MISYCKSFVMIYLLFYCARIIHGEVLRSFSGMTIAEEIDHKRFMRLDSGVDRISSNDLFANKQFNNVDKYRVHMIGDSTTRNQWLALCSLLGEGELPEPPSLQPSPPCIGEGWGHKQLIATGTFDRESPINSSRMAEILTTAHQAYNVSRFDVIYFGSTALHLLRLYPAFDLHNRHWPMAMDFVHEVSEMIRIVRAFSSCPIFHTMHYVCDSLFYLNWKKALQQTYKSNTSKLQNFCQERAPPEALEVCKTFSMTTEGSINVARLERHGLELSNDSISVVDTFALTYKQCWASKDGVHYLKLLPIQLKLLSGHVETCQSSSQISRVDT